MTDAPIEFLAPVAELAKQAGQRILQIYQQGGDILVEVKPDGSPLTEADRISHDLIIKGLAALTPDIPILSEESSDVPYSERIHWTRYWLVDPLDGTKEFIQRTGDFTVNIALVQEHHVIMGVVYAPVSRACYSACVGHGAFKQVEGTVKNRIHTRPWDGQHARVVCSRRHGIEELKPFLEILTDYEMLSVGSSLKFCLVAEGAADIYPRFGLTSEWDTAAAQCVVEQAGGAIFDLCGLPLQYNSRDSLLNPYFMVVGDTNHDWMQYVKSLQDIVLR